MTVAGWAFLAFMTFYMPWAAFRSAQRLRDPKVRPNRRVLLTIVCINQLIFTGLALLVAWREYVWLFPPPNIRGLEFVLAAGFLIPALGTAPWRWNTRTVEERKKMLWRLPQRRVDLWGWLIVALCAGIGEEIVYRGVMLQLWERVSGSWGIAVAICSIAFALAHFLQGWRSMAIIAVMALSNHWIVRISGNLYTAMFVHVTYDFLVGIIFLKLATKEGLLPFPATSDKDEDKVTT